VGASA